MNCNLNYEITENDIANNSRYSYINTLKNLFYSIIIGKTEIRNLKNSLLRSLGFNIQNLFLQISNESKTSISLFDLETYMNHNNVKYKESVLKRLIRQYDKKGNFNLSFEDFYNFINYPANIMIKDNITHKITEAQKKIFNEILLNELEIIEKIGDITANLLDDINFTCYEAFMKISDNKNTFDGNDLFIFLGDEFDYEVDIINDIIYFMDKKGDKMITYEEFQDLFLPLIINDPNKEFDDFNNSFETSEKKLKDYDTEKNVDINNCKINNDNNRNNNSDKKNFIDNNINFNDNNYHGNNNKESDFEVKDSVPNKNCTEIVAPDFYKNNIDNNKELYENKLKLDNNYTGIITTKNNNKIKMNSQYFDEFNKIMEESVIINRNIINEHNNLQKYFILENRKLFFQSEFNNNHLNQISYLHNQIDKSINNLYGRHQLINDNNKDNNNDKLIDSNFMNSYFQAIKKDYNNKNNFTINNCNSFSCINQSKNGNSENKNIVTNENQFCIEKDLENPALFKNNDNSNNNSNSNNNFDNKTSNNNIFTNIFNDLVHSVENYNNNANKNNFKIDLQPEEEKIINEYNNLNEDINNNYVTNNIFNNSNYNVNKNNKNIKISQNIPDDLIKTYDYNIINLKSTRPYPQKMSVSNSVLDCDYSYQRKHIKCPSQKNIRRLKNNELSENNKTNDEENYNTKINYENIYKNVYNKAKVENKFLPIITKTKNNKNISIDINNLNTKIRKNKSANKIIDRVANSNDMRKYKNNNHRNSMTFSKIKDNDFSLTPTNESIYKVTLTTENNLNLINYFIDFIQIVVKNETEIENFKENFSLKGTFTLDSLFNLFDKDVDNFITEKSFRTVCRTKFGLFPTKDQIILLFRRYDSDKDGKINLKDFFKMICPIKKEYMSILIEKNQKNNSSDLTKKVINYFSDLLKCLIEKETQYYLFKCQLSTQKKKKWVEVWNILNKYNSFSFYDGEDKKKIKKNDLKRFFEDNLYFLTSHQIDLIFHFFGGYGNKGNESENEEEIEEEQKVEYITFDEFINVIN